MRIATRLVLYLCTALFAVLAVFAGLAQWRRERLLDQAFFQEVRAVVAVVSALAGEEGDEPGMTDVALALAWLDRDPETYAAAVLDSAGRLIAGGPTAALACLLESGADTSVPPGVELRGHSHCGGGVAWVARSAEPGGPTVLIARRATMFKEFVRASRLITLRTVVAVLATATLVILLVLEHTLTVPLRAIRRGVTTVGEAGPPERVEVSPDRGELGDFAAAFNRMADRVERSREEAARALRELEDSARQRERFFAAAAHDLRTPIGAITGYLDLMEMGLHGEPTAAQRESLGRIRRNAEHLLQLVDDLLELARVSAGKVEIRPEPVELTGIAEDAFSVVRPAAAEKGLSLAVVEEAPVPTLVVDPLRLKQVLLNLLSNAVKFTEKGGVTLSYGPVSSEAAGAPGVRITVSDTGPGIPPEAQERIFGEFEQTSLGKEKGGTGLGLAISRHLARLMGGELTVRSEPGAGSAFTLRLPLRPVEGA